MLGYDFGERGEVDRWWTSFAVVSAERIEHDADVNQSALSRRSFTFDV